MRRPTIARWMAWIAVLALNAALLRAFLVQEMFIGVILLFVALQFALWRWLRTKRRFWLGFLVGGVVAVLFLFAAEELPKSWANRWVGWYNQATYELLYTRVPLEVADLMDNYWVQFETVVYFVPELAVAVGVGCAFWACSRVRDRRPAGARPVGAR